MKLRCDSTRLAAALAVVSRALTARTTLPVLSTVHMEARADLLVLTATNLELSIQKAVEAEVSLEGAVAVPGRLLTEFTSAVGSEPLEMELQAPGLRLRLSSPSYDIEIHGADPEEFPQGVSPEGGEQVTLAAGRLVEAIADTLAAASTDEARPILTGVRMSARSRWLTLTATDGYRLAERRVAVERGGPLTTTVPARTMAEVSRLFRDAHGSVQVNVAQHGSQVCFRGSEGEISSRVIDGAYPDTARLIPAAWTTRASLDATELNRRLRALVPFAHESANVVRLAVASGSVGLTATATDVGSARTEMGGKGVGSGDGLCLQRSLSARLPGDGRGPGGPGASGGAGTGGDQASRDRRLPLPLHAGPLPAVAASGGGRRIGTSAAMWL